MPGTLAYAAPTAVFPGGLYTAISQNNEWPNQAVAYPDGNQQVRTDGANGRHSWTVSQRRTYVQFMAFKAFWAAMRGPLVPFYFYADPKYYDASGVSTAGRYTVRFDGEMAASYDMPRWSVQLRIIEIA